MNRAAKKYFTAIFSGVLILVLWLVFAPIQFGGQSLYVILIGNSMEPRFHQGDLAILHPSKTYTVGDIVAYQHPVLGTVFHRIVGGEGDQYILKGDNNNFLDSHYPVEDEVRAKLWLHLPKVGKAIEFIQSPGIFPIVIVGFSVLVVAVLAGGKKTPKQGHPHMVYARKEGTAMKLKNILNQEGLLFLGLLVLGFLGVTIYSFTRPVNVQSIEPLTYTQRGTFNYSALVPEDLYNEGIVHQGEPLFRNIVNEFTITFDYLFDSPSESQINGVYQMVLEVSEPGGWKHTYPLQAMTQFNSTSFITSSTISFDQIQAIIDNFEAQTLVSHNEYAVIIYPEVHLAGQINGTSFEDTFAPPLTFGFNDTVIEFQGGSLEAANNPFQPVATAVVSQRVLTPNQLEFLGFGFSVWWVRVVSLSGLVLLLAGAGFFYWISTRPVRWVENFLEKNDYVIEPSVLYGLKSPRKRLVEVEGLRSLSLVAEREQQKILHLVLGSSHHFFVNSAHFSDVLYHFERPLSRLDDPIQPIVIDR